MIRLKHRVTSFNCSVCLSATSSNPTSVQHNGNEWRVCQPSVSDWDMCGGRVCAGFHSQLNDVWVPEQFEILNLPFNLPDDIEAADSLPVQDLYSHFMACQLMLANCTWRKDRRDSGGSKQNADGQRICLDAERGCHNTVHAILHSP